MYLLCNLLFNEFEYSTFNVALFTGTLNIPSNLVDGYAYGYAYKYGYLAGASELLEFRLERCARLFELCAQRLLLRAVLFDQRANKRAVVERVASMSSRSSS